MTDETNGKNQARLRACVRHIRRAQEEEEITSTVAMANVTRQAIKVY